MDAAQLTLLPGSSLRLTKSDWAALAAEAAKPAAAPGAPRVGVLEFRDIAVRQAHAGLVAKGLHRSVRARLERVPQGAICG